MTVEETVAVEDSEASAEKKMNTEEANVSGDSEENYGGTAKEKQKGIVRTFLRGRGFGFIKPAKKDQDQVIVRQENIVTDDPWPFPKSGTEVEYVLEEGKNGKLEAKEVTLLGGAKIPIYDGSGEDRDENTEDVYKGTIASFGEWKGFGFLKPDREITWMDKTTEGSLYFSKAGLFVPTRIKSGYRFKISRGKRVCFKVYKDNNGLGAYDIRKLDGTPIDQESNEECKKIREEQRKRELDESGGNPAKKAKIDSGTDGATAEGDGRQIDKAEKVFVGRVKKWKTKQKFGIIIPDQRIEFMGMDSKRGVFVREDDIVCTSEEIGLNKGSRVKFQIYKDPRGIGAYDVRGIDDMPIEYQPVNKVESASNEPQIAAAEEQNSNKA